MKCVFVTVGTTSFDDLIACVSAHDTLQVSGGGGRAGAPRFRLQLAAPRLTASLGNLAGTAALGRNPPQYGSTSGATAPLLAPPRACLTPPPRTPGPAPRTPGPSSGSPSQRPPPPLSPSPPTSRPLLPVGSLAPPFPGFSLPTLRLRLSFLRLRPSFPLLRLSQLVFLGLGLASLPLLLWPTPGRVVGTARLASAAGSGPVHLDPAGPARRAVPALPPPLSGEPASCLLRELPRGRRPPAALRRLPRPGGSRSFGREADRRRFFASPLVLDAFLGVSACSFARGVAGPLRARWAGSLRFSR